MWIVKNLNLRLSVGGLVEVRIECPSVWCISKDIRLNRSKVRVFFGFWKFFKNCFVSFFLGYLTVRPLMEAILIRTSQIMFPQIFFVSIYLLWVWIRPIWWMKILREKCYVGSYWFGSGNMRSNENEISRILRTGNPGECPRLANSMGATHKSMIGNKRNNLFAWSHFNDNTKCSLCAISHFINSNPKALFRFASLWNYNLIVESHRGSCLNNRYDSEITTFLMVPFWISFTQKA